MKKPLPIRVGNDGEGGLVEVSEYIRHICVGVHNDCGASYTSAIVDASDARRLARKLYEFARYLEAKGR